MDEENLDQNLETDNVGVSAPEEVPPQQADDAVQENQNAPAESSNVVNDVVMPQEQPQAEIEKPAQIYQQQAGVSIVLPDKKSLMARLFVKWKEKMFDRKEQRLEKIMFEVKKNKKITNTEVCKLLRISQATATRYTEELLKQGKLKQAGAGRSAYYEIK